VGTKYRAVLVPILVLNSGVFDDMRMTGTGQTNLGATNGRQVSMSPEQVAHPLAAGFTGSVSVAAIDAPLSWGVPSATAVVIATLVGAPERATIFAYNKGAVMQQEETATAKRVGFFVGAVATEELTNDGQLLLDAAVEWTHAR
jgi:hypothetical protein